jgi:Spy/CpxP family protein refolding chaperone
MEKKSLTRMAGGLGVAAIVAVGLVATVPHVGEAQDQTQTHQGDRMGARRGGHGGPGGRMGGPMGRGGALAGVMRDLTDQQREQMRAIRERHAERIRPLAERARTAREALNAAVFSGDTGSLQALSIEVGNAETELTFAQAQVESEILGVLTAEQKQKIAERRKQMEERRAEMMKRRQDRAQ